MRNMTIYGYARVSSRDQNPARQLNTLREFPVAESHIYVDHQSGKDFSRPAWQQLTKRCKKGDTIVVHSLDRLGRSYTEVVREWKKLTGSRGVQMVVLDMPLLDTRHEHPDLTHEFIVDLVLQIMSYVAENERRSIRQRQAEGIAAAKARGIHFGNPGKPLPTDFPETVQAWRKQEITLQEALNRLDCSRSYFYKNVKTLGL